jgi:hypothetical protein
MITIQTKNYTNELTNMTEDFIGAVHSQYKSALSFTNANVRKSNTEVMHDVINDCAIACFKDVRVKPDNGDENS